MCFVQFVGVHVDMHVCVHVLYSMDKWKGTVQLLQQNTDEWNIGDQTIDLRMSRRTFAAVQKYVPECYVLIEDVESHVQRAEARMFPARVQEQEIWAHTVLENVLKTKVYRWRVEGMGGGWRVWVEGGGWRVVVEWNMEARGLEGGL